MRKRVLSLTMALALCLGLAIPAFAAEDQSAEYLEFKVTVKNALSREEKDIMTGPWDNIELTYVTIHADKNSTVSINDPLINAAAMCGGDDDYGYMSGVSLEVGVEYTWEDLDRMAKKNVRDPNWNPETFDNFIFGYNMVDGESGGFLTFCTVVFDLEKGGPTEPAKPESKLFAKENVQTVKVDGKDVSFAMYSPDNGGTNYVRLVDLAVALKGTAGQFNVGYDGRVLLTAGEAYEGEASTAPFHSEMEYEMLDEPTYVNGAAQNLEGIRFEYQNGGYTYYKLRDLGEALGFNVGWDRQGEFIYIESDKPYDPNN